MADEFFDVVGHSLWVVVHDDVTSFDPCRNLSMRHQEFVKETSIADDKVSSLQHRQRRLLRVEDQRRFGPTGTNDIKHFWQ